MAYNRLKGKVMRIATGIIGSRKWLRRRESEVGYLKSSSLLSRYQLFFASV
jgi:hypothetical protein